MMTHHCWIRLCFAVACAAFTPVLNCAFSEAYALAPINRIMYESTSFECANWDGTFTGTRRRPTAQTIGTFDSRSSDFLKMTVAASADVYLAETATLTLTYLALPADGTMRFEVDSLDGFTVTLDSSQVTPTGTRFEFGFMMGQSLTFSITASGIKGQPYNYPNPAVPGKWGSNEVTISDFSVTAIPEPSTCTAVAAVIAMGAGLRKRRKPGE